MRAALIYRNHSPHIQWTQTVKTRNSKLAGYGLSVCLSGGVQTIFSSICKNANPYIVIIFSDIVQIVSSSTRIGSDWSPIEKWAKMCIARAKPLYCGLRKLGRPSPCAFALLLLIKSRNIFDAQRSPPTSAR